MLNDAGMHYLKSRDQPELSAAVWDALQGKTPDWSRQSEFDRRALVHKGLLQDDRWQQPTEVNVQIYTAMRRFGLRVFKIDFNEVTRPYLTTILRAMQHPEQGPDIVSGLPMAWRMSWIQIGLIVPAELMPESVTVDQVSPEALLAALPYPERIAPLDAEALSVLAMPDLNVLPLKPQALWQTAFSAGGEQLVSEDPVYQVRQYLPAFDWLLRSLEQPETATENERRLLAAARLSGSHQPGPLTVLRQSLAEQDYLVLPKLLSPLQLALIRLYVRRLSAEGLMEYKTDYCRDHHHNEPLMQLLQRELLRVIAKLVPEPVLASYSLLAIYHNQADLPRHVDREQCEWNLSLVLDLEPEARGPDVWPIYLEMAPGDVRKVMLEIGDAVLYSGTRYPHWRDPLPAGHRATVVFFHFVPADYAGFLY